MAIFKYEEEQEEVLNADKDDGVEMYAALDSGAVDHVCGHDDVPTSLELGFRVNDAVGVLWNAGAAAVLKALALAARRPFIVLIIA